MTRKAKTATFCQLQLFAPIKTGVIRPCLCSVGEIRWCTRPRCSLPFHPSKSKASGISPGGGTHRVAWLSSVKLSATDTSHPQQRCRQYTAASSSSPQNTSREGGTRKENAHPSNLRQKLERFQTKLSRPFPLLPKVIVWRVLQSGRTVCRGTLFAGWSTVTPASCWLRFPESHVAFFVDWGRSTFLAQECENKTAHNGCKRLDSIITQVSESSHSSTTGGEYFALKQMRQRGLRCCALAW